MVALTGTGRLADDVYLLAHHEVSGRPFLHARALGLGLAGALLAELVLEGKIFIRPGEVVVADFAACRDQLTQRVIGLLLREFEGHPVGDWLAFLARTTAREVAGRLEASGYLTRPGRGRRPGTNATMTTPVIAAISATQADARAPQLAARDCRQVIEGGHCGARSSRPRPLRARPRRELRAQCLSRGIAAAREAD